MNRMRISSLWLGAGAVVVLAILALPRAGEGATAILSDGRTIRVEGYEVDDRRAKLRLPGGGLLEMSASRLERILDEEPAAEADGDAPGTAGADLGGGGELPPVALPVRYEAGAEVLFRSRFDDWIVGLSARHGLDPALVSALVKAESGFEAAARSPKGAVGLMQLMPATASRLGVANRYDPVSNLDGGIRYLRWLADRYDDDLPRILAAYNAGEGAVDRYGGVPPYGETRRYVQKILGFLAESGTAGRGLAGR
jgi:hypothetical protein